MELNNISLYILSKHNKLYLVGCQATATRCGICTIYSYPG